MPVDPRLSVMAEGHQQSHAYSGQEGSELDPQKSVFVVQLRAKLFFSLLFRWRQQRSEPDKRGWQNCEFGETEDILAYSNTIASCCLARQQERVSRTRRGPRQVRSMTHCQGARVLRHRTASRWRGHFSFLRKVGKQIRQKP